MFAEKIPKEKIMEIVGEKFEELEKKFETDKNSLLFETEAQYNNNLEKDMDELLLGLETEYLKKKYADAQSHLQEAEQKKDGEEIKKYLEACSRISQRLNEIKINIM